MFLEALCQCGDHPVSVIVLEAWDINACKISLLSTYVLLHVYVRTCVFTY